MTFQQTLPQLIASPLPQALPLTSGKGAGGANKQSVLRYRIYSVWNRRIKASRSMSSKALWILYCWAG